MYGKHHRRLLRNRAAFRYLLAHRFSLPSLPLLSCQPVDKSPFGVALSHQCPILKLIQVNLLIDQ